MLHIYYTPIRNDKYAINAYFDTLENLLPFNIPWTFYYDIMEDNNRSNSILDYLTLGDITQCDTYQCYFTSKYPEVLDWRKS